MLSVCTPRAFDLPASGMAAHPAGLVDGHAGGGDEADARFCWCEAESQHACRECPRQECPRL